MEELDGSGLAGMPQAQSQEARDAYRSQFLTHDPSSFAGRRARGIIAAEINLDFTAHFTETPSGRLFWFAARDERAKCYSDPSAQDQSQVALLTF